MLKLTTCLTLATCLTAGSCLDPMTVAADAALFCDVEQPRRFTRPEVEWRAANAPDNLRLDYKTNLTHERECEGDDK